MIKKLITTWILGVMAVGLIGGVTGSEAEELAYANSDEITVGECLKGDFELLTFLQTIIGWKGFGDSFVEYWKDIFGRNQCQSYDILILDNQQDRVKGQIQDAFLTCNREKIPKLKKAYYRLDAEIYFVRRLTNPSFVNVLNNSLLEPASFGLTNQNETMANIPQNTVRLQDTRAIYAQMKPRYESLLGGNADFHEFFENLEYKYRLRKFNYIDCPHTYGWKAVNEKVQEFIENWGGAKEGAEYFQKSTAKEHERWERTAGTNTYSSFGDFVGDKYDININNLPPEEGWAEFEDYMTDESSAIFDKDLNSIFEQLNSASASYDYIFDRTKLISKYEALYLLNTDDAILEFLNGLDRLRGILDESTVYLDHTVSCSNSVLYKQCKN
jgi:hypothetical protein